MSRNIPNVPKEWKLLHSDAGRSYEIELITPMFGGGALAKEIDPKFAIRPTSIRGQLQFWWRATVGAQYETKERLREEQSKVWGDPTRASRVQVRVENVQATEPKPCAVIKPNHKGKDQIFWEPPFCDERPNRWGERDPKPMTYALFPFQGKPTNREGPKVDPALCIHNASFRLTLICPEDLWSQVETALWAWVNFGGIGSRSRRGCGTIKGKQVKIDPVTRKVVKVIKELAPTGESDLAVMWRQYIPKLFPQREWPTMAECLSVRTVEPPGDPIPVWDYVIGQFRHFRQGDGLGRNGAMGPSNFPEPEAIRRATQRPKRDPVFRHDDAFPRAEFGLPIVFHFLSHNKRQEPPDTVLYPEDSEGQRRERMASPLILKPLVLQSGKAVPLILRLRTPSLTGVDLRIKRKDLSTLRRELADQVRGKMQPNEKEGPLPLPDPTFLHDPRLAAYPNSPMAGSPNGSAIEAFLEFARAQGFQEVPRS